MAPEVVSPDTVFKDRVSPDTDLARLQALVDAQSRELASKSIEIENLKLLVEKLRQMHFGSKSEKVRLDIAQLELRLEELEATAAAPASLAELTDAPVKQHPVRKPLPESLPREDQTIAPAEPCCAACGGEFRVLGEDVSETLDYVPGQFKVIRQVRPKLSCRKCSRVVHAPAASKPIARGLAAPGLLTHVLVNKYVHHLPLYRQAEIFRREGVDLDRSTLAGWVGGVSQLIVPLTEALRKYVTAATHLHADDTPVPVLAPGHGKTNTGRLWTYVRDGRPWGSVDAPAVWFAYSPDRKSEHPRAHLASYSGVLQADAYAGFNGLYEGGQIRHAACWAHVRRKFVDIQQRCIPVFRGPRVALLGDGETV